MAPDDRRHTFPRFEPDNFRKNLEWLERIQAIAADKGCQPSQLALAWVLAQGEDIVPIPGTKRQTYLEENLAALDIRLTSEELGRIHQVATPGAAAGARYPAAAMRTLPQDD